MPAFQCRRWCFTWNNYTEEDVSSLKKLSDVNGMNYLLFGCEFAPTTGTPHLQGYVEFFKKKAKGGVQKFFRNPVLPVFVANSDDIRDQEKYIEEEKNVDKTPYVYGKPIADPAVREKRTWEEAFAFAEAGDFASIPKEMLVRGKKCLMEARAEAVLREDEAAREALREVHEPLPWQQQLLDVIDSPPERRLVHFVYDPVGLAGKSTFCDWMVDASKIWLITGPMKEADLAYLCVSRQSRMPRAVLFDLDRAKGNTDVPWSFIECMKNGRITSGKYTGGERKFPYCHVIVFCNTEVWKRYGGESVLSEDRLVIITV